MMINTLNDVYSKCENCDLNFNLDAFTLIDHVEMIPHKHRSTDIHRLFVNGNKLF